MGRAACIDLATGRGVVRIVGLHVSLSCGVSMGSLPLAEGPV